MLQNTSSGAATRTSFIETFAFGDKSAALRSLVAAAHSSHRFDGVATDDTFIYEALAATSSAATLKAEILTQTIPA